MDERSNIVFEDRFTVTVSHLRPAGLPSPMPQVVRV